MSATGAECGRGRESERGGINLESRESTRMGICKFTNTSGVSGICAEESLPCSPTLRLKLDGTRLRECLYLARGACNLQTCIALPSKGEALHTFPDFGGGGRSDPPAFMEGKRRGVSSPPVPLCSSPFHLLKECL